MLIGDVNICVRLFAGKAKYQTDLQWMLASTIQEGLRILRLMWCFSCGRKMERKVLIKHTVVWFIQKGDHTIAMCLCLFSDFQMATDLPGALCALATDLLSQCFWKAAQYGISMLETESFRLSNKLGGGISFWRACSAARIALPSLLLSTATCGASQRHLAFCTWWSLELYCSSFYLFFSNHTIRPRYNYLEVNCMIFHYFPAILISVGMESGFTVRITVLKQQ